MKFKIIFLGALSFIFVPAFKSHAQPTPVVLHSFTQLAGSPQTNVDGVASTGGLLLSGTNLYGTAVTGGSANQGTLFRLAINGSGFTNLHSFGSGNDGQRPNARLVMSGNKIYGTTSQGTPTQSGGIFSINSDGSGYTNFYTFTPEVFDSVQGTSTNRDGAFPFAGVVVVGNRVYGTALTGSRHGSGTIFMVLTNGLGFTNLYDFSLLSGTGTNADGATTYGTLILAGDTLYGFAYHGGTGGWGSIYAINTNGTAFTNLHSFAAAEGVYPYGSPLLVNGTLYGIASFGGTFGRGSVFKINTDGSDFAVLHPFTAEVNSTNADGGDAKATLILAGNSLVGAGVNGGVFGDGTIFTINTNGNNFVPIYQFSAYDDTANTNLEGAFPNAGVLLSGNVLYGTAPSGGGANRGTVFALTLPSPPILGVGSMDTNVVISWPTTAVGYQLQSATDLSASNWSNVFDGIGVTDANFLFTNSPGQPGAFFRLQRFDAP